MLRPKDIEFNRGILSACIREHQAEVPRMEKLKRYYKGDMDIRYKKRENPLAPNNQVSAPNPYYITTVANGFTFANPLIYSGDGIDPLLEVLKAAKSEAHDAELGEDLSIYGRGYELVHLDKETDIKLNNLPPENTFVVFSAEIDPEPLLGVYYFPVVDNNGNPDGWKLNVYSPENLTVYKASQTLDSMEIVEGPSPHYAGQVPIIEYKNNDEGIGDFERVMSEIDAYNRLMSDRLDDKDQFIDAILAIYGAELGENGEKGEQMTALKEYKVLDNLPEGSRAEYLVKTFDETGIETLRTAIKQDISKFSMVPELTDESFAGVSSGVAMEYKTLGLKWLGNMKRRMFKKSLIRRLQIISQYMQKQNMGSFDPENVDVNFDSALPVNRDALFPYAQNTLSRRTMVENLAGPFNVADVDGEMEQINEEAQEAADRQAAMFDSGNNFGSDSQ